MDALALKQEILANCLWLEERGLVVGTYGNVSARVPEGLLITPSRIEYSLLTTDDIVTVSLDGRVLEGTRLPSSELEVHRQVYLRRPDVDAVIHTHSLYSGAASTLHEDIPVIVEEQSQVIGGPIRVTAYVPAGQHMALGGETARVLGDLNAVLLANHGSVCCGKNLAETRFACLIAERVAEMWLMARAAGAPIPIPDEFVRSERERFLYRYGRAADGAVQTPSGSDNGVTL